jgi:hypothetical protein
MNPEQINFIPATIQLRSAIGASVAIRLKAKYKDGTPVDLTPYAVTAPFVTDDGTAPPVPGWAVVLEGPPEDSAIHLSLAGPDTEALAPADRSVTWHWVVWLANTGAPERKLFSHGDLGLLPP